MMACKRLPGCATCATRSLSIFSDIEEKELNKFGLQKSYLTIHRGQVLFKEGHEAQGLYCIHKGNIKITKITESGKEQIVRLAKPGNIIGYRALLCNEKYNASAVALEDAGICFFDKKYFRHLLNIHPQLAQKTLRIISSDLNFAEDMMLGIAQKTVISRMAYILLKLQDFYGIYERDGSINMNLKREDIANLIGTTTETSIRVISQLAKEGIIELKGKKIKILDQSKINMMAM